MCGKTRLKYGQKWGQLLKVLGIYSWISFLGNLFLELIGQPRSTKLCIRQIIWGIIMHALFFITVSTVLLTGITVFDFEFN